MKVLAISCVTNMAAGTTDAPINHEEVLEIGKKISGQFKALLREVVPLIAKDVAQDELRVIVFLKANTRFPPAYSHALPTDMRVLAYRPSV